MNPLLDRLMRQASRLTRGGHLDEATRAIQRTLADAFAAPAGREAEAPPAANDERLVIDVESRVIREPAPADAPPDAQGIPGAAPDADADAGAEEWIDGLFAHQNRQLAYKLFVPARGAGTPRPLVLMLHGCTQNPENFAAGTGMNRLAREHGFLVLYPAQAQRAHATRCWNWFKSQHQARGRGEPALLAALTGSIVEDRAVDPARVYVAGLSAGGAMADILGRAYPDRFAAVGVHSGLPAGAAGDLMAALGLMKNGPQDFSPSPSAAPPTIVFHGDADATVHARNGDAVAQAALAGRDPARLRTTTESGRSAAGRGYTRCVHADAAGRPVVEHWCLHGAGHAWSGGSAQGSYTDPAGPDASAEMLRFFLAHRTAD